MAHATPFNPLHVSHIRLLFTAKKKLTNAKLSCIPPALRHKTDWFRASMDPMVKNDTREMHWELSSGNSQNILNFFFPDKVLFPKSKGELVENKSDHFTMDQVLSHLVTKSVYNEKDKHWTHALKLDAKAPTAHKGSLVQFFNHVIKAVHTSCRTVTVR